MINILSAVLIFDPDDLRYF